MVTKQKILKEVNQIFRDVLDDDSIVIGEKTTASSVAEWDSLTHIQLVVAIEKFFKIRFSSLEIQKFKNVGEMCDAIMKKVSK